MPKQKERVPKISEDAQSAKKKLHKLLPPHSEVYTVVLNVAVQRPTTVYGVYVLDLSHEKPKIVTISESVAKVLGLRFSKVYRGVIVPGGGMDMSAQLAVSLSFALHGAEGQGRSLKHITL